MTHSTVGRAILPAASVWGSHSWLQPPFQAALTVPFGAPAQPLALTPLSEATQ